MPNRKIPDEDVLKFLAAIFSGDPFEKEYKFHDKFSVTFKVLSVTERDLIHKAPEDLKNKAFLALSIKEVNNNGKVKEFPTLEDFPELDMLVDHVYKDLIKSSALEDILWKKLDEFTKYVDALEEEVTGPDFTQETK